MNTSIIAILLTASPPTVETPPEWSVWGTASLGTIGGFDKSWDGFAAGLAIDAQYGIQRGTVRLLGGSGTSFFGYSVPETTSLAALYGVSSTGMVRASLAAGPSVSWTTFVSPSLVERTRVGVAGEIELLVCGDIVGGSLTLYGDWSRDRAVSGVMLSLALGGFDVTWPNQPAWVDPGR